MSNTTAYLYYVLALSVYTRVYDVICFIVQLIIINLHPIEGTMPTTTAAPTNTVVPTATLPPPEGNMLLSSSIGVLFLACVSQFDFSARYNV